MPEKRFMATCQECGQNFELVVNKTDGIPTVFDCATAMAYGNSENLAITEGENPTQLDCSANHAAGVNYKHSFTMNHVKEVV